MRCEIKDIANRWQMLPGREGCLGCMVVCDIKTVIAEIEQLEKENKNISYYCKAFQGDIEERDAEIERLEKEYQEIRYYHMEKLKHKNEKLQRVCDCAEVYLNAGDDTPSIKMGYKRELRRAIKESK